MRNIKFRAWLKDKEIMTEVHQLILNEKTNLAGKGILDEHNDFHSHNDIELMQYIGLIDKNDKEIYEGDIIKFDASIIGGQKGIGTVTLLYDLCFSYIGWAIFVENYGIIQGCDEFIGCEVIGNAYEQI